MKGESSTYSKNVEKESVSTLECREREGSTLECRRGQYLL